jgi:hypothetical protein
MGVGCLQLGAERDLSRHKEWGNGLKRIGSRGVRHIPDGNAVIVDDRLCAVGELAWNGATQSSKARIMGTALRVERDNNSASGKKREGGRRTRDC